LRGAGVIAGRVAVASDLPCEVPTSPQAR